MSAVNLVVLFGLAALAANLPFWAGVRVFGVFPLKHAKRPFWMILEWCLAFSVWMIFALWLESRQQPVHQQHWQFWVVCFCLFTLLAFPGFVLRFLWPRHK